MFVPNGLARAAVRFKPAAFVGTFVALAMAALIVSACGILLETGLRASVPPVRYADAPVVAAADQRAHRVTGIAKPGERGEGEGTVWFADSEAVRISGHPGRIDAIAVLPKDGVTAEALKAQVARVLGDRAEVHTGDGRGAVEDSSLAEAKELLVALGASFGGVATMVAVFTAAGTVALSIAQRAREFALLRAIGTAPRQIRRSIATENLLVAPLAGLVGCLPGIGLARWWFGQLKDKGAIPQPVELSVSYIPLLTAVGAVLGTALVAGYMAARRPARIKPGQALTEASVERLRFGWIRTPLGIAAAVGGFVCAGVSASTTGEDAANAALGIVMLFMLAVALLGPLIARACAALFGLPLRRAGASASLAAANSRSNARRLASAITPIVLAMAFSSVLVFMHTSEERVTREQQRAGTVADHIVTSEAGLAPDAVRQAARSPEVTAAVGLLKTGVLLPAGGYLQEASARRQVLNMIHWEALLVALAGLAIGTGIALATLIPMMKGLTGQAPYIPPLLYGSLAAAVLVIGVAAASIPARSVLRGTLDA